MNTITMPDDNTIENRINSVEKLANIRQQKGYTIDYVASKLHLRSRVIELIEGNDFSSLPGPVFIKGYLRAYAKLLDICPEPYINVFDEQYIAEKKPERALWQSKRESHKGEYVIRMFTLLFALGVILAVGIWWQKNNDSQPLYVEKNTAADLSLEQTTTELKLTDISKMQSLLNPKSEMSPLENIGD